MILFLIDLNKIENTDICLNIIKIEPNFRSLFYLDLIIKIFCKREQSTSRLHGHSFIELTKRKTKQTIKVTKLWDFDKVLGNVLWRLQGNFLPFFFRFLSSVVLTILSACSIIQLVGPCFHVIMELMGSERQLSFLRTQNCFSQEVLKPNFSMGCIIGEKLSHKLWEPLLVNQTLRKQIPFQNDLSSSAIKISPCFVMALIAFISGFTT